MTAACALARGRAEAAFTTMRDAAHTWPDVAPMWSGAALISNYIDGVSREESFELHRRYAALVEREAMDWPRPSADARTTPRPLRVGVLSPDLRGHSVARFVEPLLREHDRTAISLVVFQSNRITDDVTRRLKPMAREWHECATMSDDALAAFIASSRIDVLVELSGHTDAHSLPAVARRPAPVCVTYLGYPNTTGLSRVDARLVDARTDPVAPGGDHFATERLVRLARCFVCFEPPSDAPPSDAGNVPAPAAPAPSSGHAVRYGSFNALQKLNEATVALWSRVLRADPGSTLTIKSMTLRDERLRAEVVARFARAGVDPSRILARGPEKETRDHLAAYHDIDVALDPYPYHGTTTTCEAMWMGVPVVSRVGDRHASRVGASLLHAAGLDDLAVDTDDAFVAAAVGVGRDAARRRAWRAMDEGGLRARVRRGDLCDAPGFCREFERVVADLWQAWARG
jgi:predicted O-linked N-acetylglucosamine transferase (SPINDLY family)